MAITSNFNYNEIVSYTKKHTNSKDNNEIKTYQSAARLISYKKVNYNPIPLSFDQVKKILPYIASCNASFKNEEKWVKPFGLYLYHPNTANINLDKIDGKIEMRQDCFFDQTTALKVSICTNEKIAIIVLGNAFGSGDIEASNEEEKETFRKIQISTRDNQVIIRDFVPPIFKQTNCLINEILVHNSLKGKKIILVGHSSGATMAQFIGLKNGIETVCFNPFPIGHGLQREIGAENIELNSHKIQCISIINDFCSDLMEKIESSNERTRNLQLNFAKNFGNKYTVPSAYEGENDTHGYVLGSLMHYLGFSKRDTTSQLSKDILKECMESLKNYSDNNENILMTKPTITSNFSHEKIDWNPIQLSHEVIAKYIYSINNDNGFKIITSNFDSDEISFFCTISDSFRSSNEMKTHQSAARLISYKKNEIKTATSQKALANLHFSACSLI